jgi:hypothetical protein
MFEKIQKDSDFDAEEIDLVRLDSQRIIDETNKVRRQFNTCMQKYQAFVKRRQEKDDLVLRSLRPEMHAQWQQKREERKRNLEKFQAWMKDVEGPL